MYHVTPTKDVIVAKEADKEADLPNLVCTMQEDHRFRRFLSGYILRQETQRATLFISWICQVVYNRYPGVPPRERAKLVHEIIQHSHSRRVAVAAFSKQFENRYVQ